MQGKRPERRSPANPLDAGDRFSAVVDAAIAGDPQRVTRRGKPAVVVLAVEEYERLSFAQPCGVPRELPGDLRDRCGHDDPVAAPFHVEEHRCVEHVLGVRPAQAGAGAIVKVVLGQQDAHALVVDPEEGRRSVNECVRTGMELEVEAVRAAPGASPAMALAPLTQDDERDCVACEQELADQAYFVLFRSLGTYLSLPAAALAVDARWLNYR